MARETAFPRTQSENEDGKRKWRIPARAAALLLTPSADELSALTIAINELETVGMVNEAAMMRHLKPNFASLAP
jgi:hypothetical protein